MGGCLTRPLDARCIDIVRPALSKDDKAQAVLEQSSPSHLLQRLSPLDSALCVRGLVVYWAFGFDRELDPDVIRASLASTLVKYPALAGRARVRARRGATLDLDVDLDMSNPNCGVPFEVCVDASTTLADLQRNGPEPGKNNITPSKLFVPLDIRCCEKGSTLCAVRVTKLAGATDAPDAKPATVLAVSWSHALADGSAMRLFCESWTAEALALAEGKRELAYARHAPSDVVAAETVVVCEPLDPEKKVLDEPCHDRLEATKSVDSKSARAFPALRLDDSPKTITLARGACGLLGAVAFDRLTQVTVHLPGPDASKLKSSLNATSTNDAVVAAVWILFRRLRTENYETKKRRAFFSRNVRVPKETGCAIQPVNYRGDDVRGLPHNLFGNASLMVCARLDSMETQGTEERQAAASMARATRRAVTAAKTPEGKESARGEILALGSVSTATQIAAAVAAVGQKDVFISAWQFPELWGFDFDGFGEGPAYFMGSVQPSAAWTACAHPAKHGGLNISMTVPTRVAGRAEETMAEVVKALSDEDAE